MDRTLPGRARIRFVGLGVASLLIAPSAGCSQLSSFRPFESPRIASAGDPAIDPYLAHHRRPNKPGEAPPATATAPDLQTDPAGAPADASRTTTTRSTIHPTIDAGSDQPVAVSLEPPVSLTVATAGAPALEAPAPGASPRLARSNSDPLAQARKVVAKARANVDAMASYQVRINRQERVGETLLPAEDVLLSIRRAPRAVRLEWPNGPLQGREVIYRADDPSGLMHVHMTGSLMPVSSFTMAPDSPLVKRKSRHPITEAGFDTIISQMETALALGGSDGSRIEYQGVETPEAVGRPCHKMMRELPGETWVVHMDAQTALPAMVQATGPSGDLLERYVFRDVKADLPELAAADAFNPDIRWGGSPGLLGRLARSTGLDAKATATSIQR